MDGAFPFLFGLTMAVVVLVFAGYAWWNNPKRIVKRMLRDTERTNVGDAVEGATVKIVGTLRHVGEPLRAPLSGRSCAYYEVRVEEHRGKNNWSTIVRESEGSQFLLEDGTGKALVKLDDPSTAVVEDLSLRSGTFNDPSVSAQEYLTKHGVDSTSFLGFNKTLRYFEGVLEEGETVVVYGRASWEADPDPDSDRAGEDYRNRPKRLRIDAPAGARMLVSDDPEAT